jgi:hypothetical protein
MGISNVTILTIQNSDNEIVCNYYGQDKETGKWSGVVYLYKNGHIHTTLFSSNCVFDTKDIAISKMKEIVEKIKKMDMNSEIEKLRDLLKGDKNAL